MPSIVPTLEWLEGLAWTTAIRESIWGYPIIETAHVASVVAFAGLVFMMDLRLVGIAFTKEPLMQFQRRLFPWQMVGFVPSMATGLLVFTVDPLRYYGNVLRGVFLRGSGLDVLWPEAVILTAMGASLLVLASLRFRKSLD